MESPEASPPMPDDEDTYKDRYLGSMVQVKGDVAGLQFELIDIAAKMRKQDQILRVILLASVLAMALVVVKVYANE